jgi:uncharacterized protein YlbG (UPF0298 family)
MYEEMNKQYVHVIPIDRLVGSKIYTTDAALEEDLKKYGYITKTIKRRGYWSIYIERKE